MPPVPPMSRHFAVDVVVAGHDREAVDELELIAVGLLDGVDPVDLRQLGEQVGRHVDHAPARDVVEDDRRATRGLRHFPEVGGDPAAVRLVVVRRHGQDRVAPRLDRFLGQMDGVPRVVGARATDDRRLVPELTRDQCDEAEVLLIGHRRRLTRGPGHDQPVRAVREQVAADCDRALLIDGAISTEGRDHGREQAFVGTHGCRGWHARRSARERVPRAELRRCVRRLVAVLLHSGHSRRRGRLAFALGGRLRRAGRHTGRLRRRRRALNGRGRAARRLRRRHAGGGRRGRPAGRAGRRRAERGAAAGGTPAAPGAARDGRRDGGAGGGGGGGRAEPGAGARASSGRGGLARGRPAGSGGRGRGGGRAPASGSPCGGVADCCGGIGRPCGSYWTCPPGGCCGGSGRPCLSYST